MPKRANFNPKHMFGSNILRRQMNNPPALEEAQPAIASGQGLLLDPGLGSAFSSPQEYIHLTGKPIIGLGLSEVSEKLKNLKASKLSGKTKNISFKL